FDSPEGGNQIDADWVIGADAVFFAQWTKNGDPQPVKYTVTFDPNGGKIASGSATKTVESGKTVGALPAATRSGYSLKGWFTAKTGGSKISASTKVTKNVTYYAQRTKGAEPKVVAVEFASAAVAGNEGGSVAISVNGGSELKPTVAQLYLTYNSAVAADIDLKTAAVRRAGDSAPYQTNLKFPVSLYWAKGDTRAKTVTIPLKADKAVEPDEIFTLQLAGVVGNNLGAKTVCTVMVKDPAYAELAAKIAAGTETPQERKTWEKIQKSSVCYMRGVADPADGGKVTGGNYCPEGKKVSLKASAAKGFRFVGWRRAGDGAGEDARHSLSLGLARSNREPRAARGGYRSPSVPDSGDLVATTPTLVIDRTAKPAANTKTSTTITGVLEDTTFFACFEPTMPEIRVVVESTDAAGAAPSGKGVGKYVAGNITGIGRYTQGKKKVTIKATSNKGYVFNGWYDEKGALITQLASYVIAEMGAKDVQLTAKYVTAAEDLNSITLKVGDKTPTTGKVLAWSIRCGVAVNWPVTSGALSATTVKASGLPSGLKLVLDTATTAYSVGGAPTAASKTNAKTGVTTPSNVKFTVTT
ncbi:MAG: InlB B-repeat-containing protein, partial [Kiritimatiellae bacterium]|nr:InlB B-repeat-containing protein [Kiritimatiellia bacterium]